MFKELVFILALALWPASIQSSPCDEATIEKIKNIWDGKPPTDILRRTVGLQTNLYLPPYMLDLLYIDRLECYQTYLDKNESTAVDNYYFRDPRNRITFPTYEMVLKEPGVISLVQEGKIWNYFYVAYLDEDVIGYYQCGDDCSKEKECIDYDPFLEILILHGRNRTEAAESITKATALLLTLGIQFTPFLESDACFIGTNDDDVDN